jgi:hypothetical protein
MTRLFLLYWGAKLVARMFQNSRMHTRELTSCIIFKLREFTFARDTHTYIHTNIHTYIHTCVQEQAKAGMNDMEREDVRVKKPYAYIHTHTYIHVRRSRPSQG